MSVRRYGALAAVIAGGTLAAAPFYKSATLTPSARAAQPELTAGSELRAGPPRIAIETGGEEARSPVPRDEPNSAWEAAETRVFDLAGDGSPLPALPRAPVVRTISRSGATIHEPDFSEAAVERAPPPARVVAPRRHRIADGDSLPVLALRYLGDERRSEEIAQFNCDVIRDPNLLPVGQWILIPRESMTNDQ